jgi:lysine biosynthesis protein LysW
MIEEFSPTLKKEKTMPTQQHMERIPEGECPVCGADVLPTESVEESEILSCPTCLSMLVVDDLGPGRIVFKEAPQIEEDWGQ